MSLAEKLGKMTPEAFELLPEREKAELIDYNDEYVREWRGVCQLCRKALRGTRASLRSHVCDDPS